MAWQAEREQQEGLEVRGVRGGGWMTWQVEHGAEHGAGEGSPAAGQRTLAGTLTAGAHRHGEEDGALALKRQAGAVGVG